MGVLQSLRHPQYNSWDAHPKFLDSYVYKVLGDFPSWTISDKDKRPIDIGYLEWEGKIRGASPADPGATVKLSELKDIVPDAANAAFMLDSDLHEVCILDVEPKCPNDERTPFFDFPYLWVETSMSGHGLHFVLPVPKAIKDDPYANSRAAIKDADKRYEILLNHWVTFTRNEIEPTSNPDGDWDAWEAFAKHLVESAPKSAVIASGLELIDVLKDHPQKTQNWDKIVEYAQVRAYEKDPADFNNDMSRYEFGYISHLYRQVKALAINDQTRYEYDANELAWLTYDAAREVIPWRPKHNEFRVGLPWLLYQSKMIVSYDTNSAKGDDK